MGYSIAVLIAIIATGAIIMLIIKMRNDEADRALEKEIVNAKEKRASDRSTAEAIFTKSKERDLTKSEIVRELERRRDDAR